MTRSLLLLTFLLLVLPSCNNSTPTSAHPATTAVQYHYHVFMFGPMYDRNVTIDAKGLLTCTDTMTTPQSPPITDTASRQLTSDEQAQLLTALSSLPNSDLTIPMVPDGASIQIDYLGHHYFCGDSDANKALNPSISLLKKLSNGITSGKATPAGVR